MRDARSPIPLVLTPQIREMAMSLASKGVADQIFRMPETYYARDPKLSQGVKAALRSARNKLSSERSRARMVAEREAMVRENASLKLRVAELERVLVDREGTIHALCAIGCMWTHPAVTSPPPNAH